MRYAVAVGLLLVLFAVQTFASTRTIKVALIVDTVFDVTAKDVFFFHGPVIQRPGIAAGFDKEGKEVRVGAAPVTAQPASQDSAAPARVEKLASLQAACASCHTGPRVKGGFALYSQPGVLSPVIDWKEVLAAIEPQGKNAPRMPPASAGKPPVSAADLDEVRRLAR